MSASSSSTGCGAATCEKACSRATEEANEGAKNRAGTGCGSKLVWRGGGEGRAGHEAEEGLAFKSALLLFGVVGMATYAAATADRDAVKKRHLMPCTCRAAK